MALDEEHTQIVTFARSMDLALETRPCLVSVGGFEIGRRHVVGGAGTSASGAPRLAVVLADTEVSRSHCSLAIAGDDIVVTDLGSTNGTFIDGKRLDRPTPLPVGAVLQVGRQSLKHEWRTQREILQSDELDRDLEKANSYVQALLPPPLKLYWRFMAPFRG